MPWLARSCTWSPASVPPLLTIAPPPALMIRLPVVLTPFAPMVVVPPGFALRKNARFFAPPSTWAFWPIVMLPVKIVPVPLPNTTKLLVLMLAMSALLTVVVPADSMPKELLPVRGRRMTAAAPPSTVPSARLNASALRITFAVLAPPPLLITPPLVRLSAVSEMTSLVVEMPVTCSAPESIRVSVPPLVPLNLVISFGPARLVMPLVVVVSVSATIKPFDPSLIDAAFSVTLPSVRMAAGCAVPLSSMLPPAVIRISPGPVPVPVLVEVPMRTPLPSWLPALRMTLPPASMVMLLAKAGVPTAPLAPMPTPLFAVVLLPRSSRLPPTVRVRSVAVAVVPAPPSPPIRTPGSVPPDAFAVSVTLPSACTVCLAPRMAATLPLPPPPAVELDIVRLFASTRCVRPGLLAEMMAIAPFGPEPPVMLMSA